MQIISPFLFSSALSRPNVHVPVELCLRNVVRGPVQAASKELETELHNNFYNAKTIKNQDATQYLTKSWNCSLVTQSTSNRKDLREALDTCDAPQNQKYIRLVGTMKIAGQVQFASTLAVTHLTSVSFRGSAPSLDFVEIIFPPNTSDWLPNQKEPPGSEIWLKVKAARAMKLTIYSGVLDLCLVLPVS